MSRVYRSYRCERGHEFGLYEREEMPDLKARCPLWTGPSLTTCGAGLSGFTWERDHTQLASNSTAPTLRPLP